MSKVRVSSFSISIDGYGAGPDQDPANPLGIGGMALHDWFIGRTDAGGDRDVDDAFANRSFENVGVWIMGRNMFGPVRGSWPDDTWKGWWGDNPPFHVPVFVLTNHARAPITMKGGTTFHFVTDGIHAALNRAKETARGKDVQIGGGVSTVRQYLTAGLIDEMHLAIAPVLLGRGEHLFNGIDALSLGFTCTKRVATDHATHLILTK